MAHYQIQIGPEPAAVIRGLAPELKRSVRNALRAIADDPSTGDPLRGELEGLWRYRVRRFRIVYSRDGRVVRILAVGHRRAIYEEAAEARRRR